MKYQFDVIDNKILMITTEGAYTLDDNIDFLTAIRDNLETSQTEFVLIDYRKSDVSFNILSSFDRPAMYESLVGDVRPRKIAIVFPSITDDHKFYEDVCVNRGWNVCFFGDIEIGLEWLRI